MVERRLVCTYGTRASSWTFPILPVKVSPESSGAKWTEHTDRVYATCIKHQTIELAPLVDGLFDDSGIILRLAYIALHGQYPVGAILVHSALKLRGKGARERGNSSVVLREEDAEDG